MQNILLEFKGMQKLQKGQKYAAAKSCKLFKEEKQDNWGADRQVLWISIDVGTGIAEKEEVKRL